MRRGRIILALGAAAVGIPLAVLALCWDGEFAGPSSALWRAIVAVESGGNPLAYNKSGKSAGIVQIRPLTLLDINRIAEMQGLDTQFTLADRFDPEKCRLMWRIYLTYYGQKYTEHTHLVPSDNVYARIWNGGPEGWRKSSTLAYWRRVRDAPAARSPRRPEEEPGALLSAAPSS
ncbi:MAG: transglycosylase SLT domain-containing protein [Planctomycetota bacterium]|nr:transglycosylase SLT domain-containing protein [Planctomycetota bacterium]